MNRSFALVLAVAATTVLGCRAVPRARVAPGTRVAVVLDRAIAPDAREAQANAQQQIGDWMERDLVNVLGSAGFAAGVVASPNHAPPGEGSYVLAVKLVRYNPGSKAARMFVGFGAGSAGLDISYELRTANGRVLLAQADGVNSSIDWRKIARKLNVNMTRAVSGVLSR
jgi:hypothetical protein